MPSEKQMRQEAQDEKDRIKAGKAYDNEMPEPDTTFGRLSKKAGRALLAGPSGVLGGIMLGLNPDGPDVIDAAKFGSKIALAANKKETDEAMREVEAATRRAQSVKRKPNTGETTNAMGDNYKKGGSVSSASKRADGIAQRGKTKGKML
jgi:hypothetical protein